MADYKRGNNAQIVVGAAALFVNTSGAIDPTASATAANGIPAQVAGESYKETLSTSANSGHYRNVGYTTNGLELDFQPNFGEVTVDQVLDSAKLFKQGMKVELKTSFAEATLENLMLSVAANPDTAYSDNMETVGQTTKKTGNAVELYSGELGEYPIERGIIAVGASVQASAIDTEATGTGADQTERVYVGYRALSITNVAVSAKRDAATEFAVTFRLLPEDASGSYGKIVDRTY